MPKGKGMLAFCGVPVLRAGIPTGELRPSMCALGFAAHFPSVFPSHSGLRMEIGVGERWESVCALGRFSGGGGGGKG